MDTINSKYIYIVTAKLQFIKTSPYFFKILTNVLKRILLYAYICVWVYIRCIDMYIYKKNTIVGFFIPKSLTLFAVYGRKWRLLARKSHPRKITFL